MALARSPLVVRRPARRAGWRGDRRARQAGLQLRVRKTDQRSSHPAVTTRTKLADVVPLAGVADGTYQLAPELRRLPVRADSGDRGGHDANGEERRAALVGATAEVAAAGRFALCSATLRSSLAGLAQAHRLLAQAVRAWVQPRLVGLPPLVVRAMCTAVPRWLAVVVVRPALAELGAVAVRVVWAGDRRRAWVVQLRPVAARLRSAAVLLRLATIPVAPLVAVPVVPVVVRVVRAGVHL